MHQRLFSISIMAVIIVSLFLLSACGMSAKEKREAAILSATIYLSKGDCQAAIDLLEAEERDNRDAHFLKVLSSAYACRAGFSVTTFFANDLSKTSTPAPLGGTSIYSTSLVTATSPLQNDPKYSDLLTAINLLLYAGGIASTAEPTVLERAKYFGTDEAQDINTQLLFMMFVQMGKFMHYYANGDAAGLKGAGTGLNKCFTGYNDAGIVDVDVLAVINALPVTCRRGSESAHSELAVAVAAATRKTRLCQGVVLLNGIFNILPLVVNSASGQLSTTATAFKAAITVVNSAMLVADPSIGIVATTINQSICEDNSNVPVAKLESYFAMMYESLFLP